MRKLPLIIVEWSDITSHSSWYNEQTASQKQALVNMSVGWKLKSDREFIRLTPMRSGSGDCTDVQVIPRGCIKSIRRLE